MAPDGLRKSAQRVQAALDASGLDLRVSELPASTRTAAEAAEAVGCEVEQIAKSIVFRGEESSDAVLVIASGGNRIDERRVEERFGEPVRMATPDFVREATGFVIGGVPPCGHLRPLRIFVDEELLGHDEIWAAAGTPHALFRLTPAELLKLTGGTVVRVA